MTIPGIASGIKQINSTTRFNLGNFRWTHTTVGTIKKRIKNITIPALIRDLTIEINKSGWLGITFQASKVRPFWKKAKGLVEKSNIE
jgi:hypothetical protein